MARFTPDDIDIDPDDYIDACNSHEIRELINALKETDEFDENCDELLIGQFQVNASFIKDILTLKNSWIGMSLEDEETIHMIAKKYGAL